MKRYQVWVTNTKTKRFDSLEAAMQFCGEIFACTGIVLGISEIKESK